MELMRMLVEKNKKFIFAIVFIPVVIIGLIGLIFGDGVREVPVAVLNKDLGMEMPYLGGW